MSYRVEVAKTGRAVCQATHCKKEGTKIEKGELRQGTLATIGEHTSMKYRHWGCVTPKVIANWKESSGMDMELVDGYDELPEESQKKVKRALEQGHVDDDDWNGDKEMNRYNPDRPMQGMFVKTPKKAKKAKDGSEDDNVEESPAKKQASKKRGRAKTDDDNDAAEPAPKKAKGKTKKAAKATDDDEPKEVGPPKKATKGKKAKAGEVQNPEPESPVPAPKKGKAKKAKSAATVDQLEDDASPVEEAPAKKTKSKKGTAKPVKAVDDEPAAPKTELQKRQRKGKKAPASGED